MSDWEIAENVRCVVCPDCAFTFDAVHTDTGDSDTYSCPLCAEARLTDDLDAAYGALRRLVEGWRPDAEPVGDETFDRWYLESGMDDDTNAWDGTEPMTDAEAEAIRHAIKDGPA